MAAMRFPASLLAAIPILVVACADAPERVRRVTYPPDFRYFAEGEVEGLMQQLAAEVVALEQQMRGESPEPDPQAVVAILTRMRALTAELNRGALSNHPRIEAMGPRLRNDVERALGAARAQPPNYYFAGEVAGACRYCHAPPPGPQRGPSSNRL